MARKATNEGIRRDLTPCSCGAPAELFITPVRSHVRIVCSQKKHCRQVEGIDEKAAIEVWESRRG